MKSQIPGLATFINMIVRQKTILLVTIAICTALGLVSYKLSPKTFKVQATIAIQTQYFQVPLVRDFLSETFDGQELKAQREALVRRALDYDYLKELGLRYGLFGKKQADEITSFDLEMVSKRFEIVPLGSASFLISFLFSKPEIAYNILEEAIAQIRTTLTTQRRTTLFRIHNAIEEQLELLSFGKSPSLLASRPEIIEQEANRIREEISKLKASYSDKHPRIAELSSQLSELTRLGTKSHTARLPSPESTQPALGIHAKVFSGAKVDETSKDLYQDLLKKYHYLEVVISLDQQNHDGFLSLLQEPYVPKAPLWPKLPIFFIWGVALGFLVGTLLILVLEVVRARHKL